MKGFSYHGENYQYSQYLSQDHLPLTGYPYFFFHKDGINENIIEKDSTVCATSKDFIKVTQSPENRPPVTINQPTTQTPVAFNTFSLP